jgi:hypothetical protein
MDERCDRVGRLGLGCCPSEGLPGSLHTSNRMAVNLHFSFPADAWQAVLTVVFYIPALFTAWMKRNRGYMLPMDIIFYAL